MGSLNSNTYPASEEQVLKDDLSSDAGIRPSTSASAPRSPPCQRQNISDKDRNGDGEVPPTTMAGPVSAVIGATSPVPRSTPTVNAANTTSTATTTAKPRSSNNSNSIRPIDIVVALAEFDNQGSDQKLSFQPGDTIFVLNKHSSGWWDGVIVDPNLSNTGSKVTRGWFPCSYTRQLRDNIGYGGGPTSMDMLGTRSNKSSRSSSIVSNPNFNPNPHVHHSLSTSGSTSTSTGSTSTRASNIMGPTTATDKAKDNDKDKDKNDANDTNMTSTKIDLVENTGNVDDDDNNNNNNNKINGNINNNNSNNNDHSNANSNDAVNEYATATSNEPTLLTLPISTFSKQIKSRSRRSSVLHSVTNFPQSSRFPQIVNPSNMVNRIYNEQPLIKQNNSPLHTQESLRAKRQQNIHQESATASSSSSSSSSGSNTNTTLKQHNNNTGGTASRKSSRVEEHKTLEPEKINILSLEEVEMIMNSVHVPITATWTPLPVIHDSEIGDNVIFYNKQLDIYCSELPLVLMSSATGVPLSNPVNTVGASSSSTSNTATSHLSGSISSATSTVVSTGSVLLFPDNDNLVDMRPRDLDKATRIPPTGGVGNDTVLSVQSASSLEEGETERTLGHEDLPKKAATQNQRSSERLESQLDTNDRRHLALNESIQSGAQRLQPTIRHQAILSEDNLFYYHTKDVRTWLELEELTIHFVKMAHSMFLKVDRFNFVKFFNLVSNFLTYTQLACRLIQDEIKEKQCYKTIKKLLKQLISSLSRININSIIYFDSSSRFQATFARQEAANQPSDQTLLQSQQQTGSPPVQYSSQPYPSSNAASSRQNMPSTPIAPNTHMNSFLDSTILLVNTASKAISSDENQQRTNKTSAPKLETAISNEAYGMRTVGPFTPLSRNGSIGVDPLSSVVLSPKQVSASKMETGTRPTSVSPATSTADISSTAKLGKHPEEDSDSRIPIRSIFEALDQEFLGLLKNIQTLHHILQTSVLEPNSFILPQVLPRFFKDSFNGGSWSNPFSTFMASPNEECPDSGPNLRRNSTELLPPNFTSPRNLTGEDSSSSRYESDNNVTLTVTSPNQDISGPGYENFGAPYGYESPKTSIGSHSFQNTSNMPPSMERAVALAAGVGPDEFGKFSSDKGLSSLPLSSSLPFGSRSQMTMGSGNSATGGRSLSKSKSSKRKVRYPLNNEPLLTMKKISAQINEKLSTYLVSGSDGVDSLLYQPRSKSRSLEINSKTYEQLSQNSILIEILENLDLTIFMNLRKLINSSSEVIDAESEEFLKHEMTSISNVVVEFFDVKQAFHNISVQFIMATQLTTVEDPYIFSSMRSNYKVGFNDMKLLERLTANKTAKRIEKKTANLYRRLVEKDIENNDSNFLNTAQYFIESCEKYAEVSNAACMIVEQLIEERENLLNYAARMMKNGLITELLTGAQENWFDEDEDDDDEEFYMDNGSTPANVGQGYAEGGDKDNADDLWFLQPTHEYTLIYDSKGRVKGGTKEALIEHLTNHNIIDPAFNVAMLISFRSIFTVKDFFYSLIYRYNMYPPEGLNFDDYSIWIERRLNPIKSRVINILKTFLQQYWTPYYLEPGLSAIESFVEYAVSENIPGAAELLQKVRELLVKDINPSETEKENGSSNNRETGIQDPRRLMVRPLLATTPSTIFHLKKMKLLHFDPLNYARQLTIREHDLYLRITMFECLDRAWGNKYCDMGGSPNITKFIQNANTLTNFVSYSIVKQHFVKSRAQYIRFFITVAEHCKELNNFSSMTAIVSALYSSPIYRLKKTWDIVPEESKATLRKLNNLMDSKKNFIRYRGLLRSVKDVACVPFFGVYLSDLTFTNVGNPDYLHGNTDIINFGKRSRIVDIIEEILSFKRIHYKLKRSEEILGIIDSSFLNVPHIEKQYKLSLDIEPRTGNRGNAPAGGVAGDTTSTLVNTKAQVTLQGKIQNSQAAGKFADGEVRTTKMESDRPGSTPNKISNFVVNPRNVPAI